MNLKQETRKSKHAKLLRNYIGFLYGISPVFSGNRESEIAVNYAIIKILALGKPSYTWDISRKVRKDSLIQALDLEPHYTTVDRHLADLVSYGYLEELASTPAKVGRKSIFGLTLKGLTVAESLLAVRANILEYLKWRESFDSQETGPKRNVGDRTIRLIQEFMVTYPEGQEMVEQLIFGAVKEILNRRDFETLSEDEVAELREESFVSQLVKKQKLSNGEWKTQGIEMLRELVKTDPDWRETWKKYLAKRNERAELFADIEKQISSVI